MFAYYLRLALTSLRRSPGVTILLVVAIGLGIGASMTLVTVLHVMSGDPVPSLSAHLYAPHLDPRPVAKVGKEEDGPSDDFTYVDAMALLHAKRAERQAVMAGGQVLLRSAPDEPNFKPSYVTTRFVTADFFPMFEVPLRAGRALDEDDVTNRSRVVVVDEVLARRLFGSDEPLGKKLRLGEGTFTIVGITAAWHPEPLFYDDSSGRTMFGKPDMMFIPLTTSIDLGMEANNLDCWGDTPDTGNNHLSGECSWLQVWVQLGDDKSVASYNEYLRDYERAQKERGRFERSGSTRLYRLDQWLDHAHIVPGDLRLQLWLALGFLAVCVLNIVALLMAKFLRRGGEISIRRALGARRLDIFAQCAAEAFAIGIGGGLLGLVLTMVGLWTVRQRPDDYAHLAHLDLTMLLATLGFAVGSAVLACLLPAWRACLVPPALQLKSE